MLIRGRNPSCAAWRVTLNAPEMTDCEAITVATVASTTSGTCAHAGTSEKNGFATALGERRTSEP